MGHVCAYRLLLLHIAVEISNTIDVMVSVDRMEVFLKLLVKMLEESFLLFPLGGK